MHSTVTAEIKQGSRLLDALVAAFPMASMTGAPKIRAMEIIENLEVTKRGLFSGTIGFFTPGKNADFNVIIRSLIYNENRGHLSCHVGGGITDLSNPEAEYEECLTKVSPILDLVNALHH
jgi:para-aminobenzoate synthetase component 1